MQETLFYFEKQKPEYDTPAESILQDLNLSCFPLYKRKY